MLIERIDQRVLGAIRLLDRVTQSPVKRAMRISSEHTSLLRNRQGLYVITGASGLEAHTASFRQPPQTPGLAANEYGFEIADPQQRYLPRLVTLRLPRDPDPDHAGSVDSLFSPMDVTLYPASTALLSTNWSTVRVSVTQGADPLTAIPVAGCLIRIVEQAEGTLLASGISDERGEALVIVAGVPVTKFADDEETGNAHSGAGGGIDEPVLVNTLPVRLELSHIESTSWPVNPDVLEQNHAVNLRESIDLTLSTGRMEKAPINLT